VDLAQGAEDTEATGLIERLQVALEAVSAGVVVATPGALPAAIVRLVAGDPHLSVTPIHQADPPVSPPHREDAAAPISLTIAVDPRLTGLAADLRRCGLVAVEARDRSSLPLAEVHVGITPALAAIAESGTVIVGPGDAVEGLLAVLPPHHIVVVSAAVVEADLPAALARVAGDAAQAGSRLVFISGPSRTADIELTTVLGVHGPLRLDVVIVREWGEV
jgi:L-lactate dehydrogenase complex protein LldG